MKFIKQSIFIFSIIFFLLSIMNINVNAVFDNTDLYIGNGEIEKNIKDQTTSDILTNYKGVISFSLCMISFSFFILSLVQVYKINKCTHNLKAKKKHIIFLILFIVLSIILWAIKLSLYVYY